MAKNTSRRKNGTNKVVPKRPTPPDGRSKSLSTTNISVSMEDVQKELEDEFCPPLDTTLVAALLADSYNPTEPYIELLRHNLHLLCSNAQKAPNTPSPTPGNPLSADALGGSSHSDTYVTSSASCASSSQSQIETDQSSMTSDATFSSPFGFLTSLFLDMPPKVIETTLASAGWVKASPESDVELDMDAVVSALLSEEFINEIIERGYAAPGEEGDNSDRRREQSWELVQKTKKAASSGNVDTNGLGPSKGKRIKPVITPKTVTMSLFNVRQRYHVPLARSLSASALPPPDPWVHFASLATQLHHLVPSTSYARFLALFHDPAYATTAVAVRAHLVQLGAQSSPNVLQDDIDTLAELVPILDEDEARLRADVMQDAAMCLGATSGRKEDAYDLMVLLRDLDVDGAVVAHSAPQPIGSRVNDNASGLSSASSPMPSPMPSLPSISAPTSPSMFPRTPTAPLFSAPNSPQRQAAKAGPLNKNPTAWTTVNRRANRAVTSKNEPSEGIAAYIPATQPSSYTKTNMSGYANGPSANNSDNAETCRERADEYRVKRDTALRQASSHWQRRKLGGEVAFFYAEEARKFDAERRQWNIRGARTQVSKSMYQDDSGGCSIDLHGLTVNEGIIVTKEILNHWSSSNASGRTPPGPFTIITGIGRHSSGNLGVLGPAVRKALEEDGWYVQKEHGKLVVTGAP